MQLAVIPIFLAEISPAHMRGSMGVLYWLGVKVCRFHLHKEIYFNDGPPDFAGKCGGLLITGIVRVTSNNRDNSAWQIPIGLIFVIPVIVILLVWFIPEVSIIFFKLPRFLAIILVGFSY